MVLPLYIAPQDLLLVDDGKLISLRMGEGASITAPLNREIDLRRPILHGGRCKVEIDIAHVVPSKCYVLRETSHQSAILRLLPLNQNQPMLHTQRKWDPLERTEMGK